MSRPILKIDKCTREVVKRFSSSVEAAKWHGTDNRNLLRICDSKTLPNEWWYLRFEDEFDPDEDFSGRRGCPVVTRNIATGEETWFPSRVVCAEELGVDYRAICRGVRDGCRVLWTYEVRESGGRIK